MIEATKTLETLLKLPHCVEVEPDQGFKKAILNLHNGMVVQLPKSGGFSMMGNWGKSKAGADCLIASNSNLRSGKGDPEGWMLAGADLKALIDCWSAQAKIGRQS